MEEQRSVDVTEEVLTEEKQQKSRNRIFGLLVVVNLALLAIFIYEIVILATSSGA